MPKYRMKFELYGRNMVTTIEARDELDAKMQLRNKVEIHSVEEVKADERRIDFDDLPEDFKTIFGL